MNMHSKQKRSFALAAKDLKGRRRPTLPRVVVPSARTGLTSLFGKVRGVPRRYSHPSFSFPAQDLGLCTLEMVPAPGGNKYRDISEDKTYKKILNHSHTQLLGCQEISSPPEGGEESHTSLRAISTTWLRTLLHLHLWPINVVVSHGPLKKSHLVVGFALICFQRLSLPDVATQQCPGRDNW